VERAQGRDGITQYHIIISLYGCRAATLFFDSVIIEARRGVDVISKTRTRRLKNAAAVKSPTGSSLLLRLCEACRPYWDSRIIGLRRSYGYADRAEFEYSPLAPVANNRRATNAHLLE
jgi:hypothetical protein